MEDEVLVTNLGAKPPPLLLHVSARRSHAIRESGGFAIGTTRCAQLEHSTIAHSQKQETASGVAQNSERLQSRRASLAFAQAHKLVLRKRANSVHLRCAFQNGVNVKRRE